MRGAIPFEVLGIQRAVDEGVALHLFVQPPRAEGGETETDLHRIRAREKKEPTSNLGVCDRWGKPVGAVRRRRG